MAGRRDQRVVDPLPGWPGGGRRWLLIAAPVLAVAADRLWLDGAVFGSALWRGLLWLLPAAGLAIGGLAHLRRSKDG